MVSRILPVYPDCVMVLVWLDTHRSTFPWHQYDLIALSLERVLVGCPVSFLNFWFLTHFQCYLQELGKQQENLTDFSEDFGSDYNFSGPESSNATKDFSSTPGQPHERSSTEGPAYTYDTNGPFRNVNETGDASPGQMPLSAKVNAKLFGGFRDPGNPFAAAFGQNRAFHQDHSSVSGLTAEDIDKARQAKTDPDHKPHKQMVCDFINDFQSCAFATESSFSTLSSCFSSSSESGLLLPGVGGKGGRYLCSLILVHAVCFLPIYLLWGDG